MARTVGRYGTLDYPKLAKYGFLLGATMFFVGAVGEILLAGVFSETAPGWVDTLLFDVEALGVLVAFLAVAVFGVIMPLTE